MIISKIQPLPIFKGNLFFIYTDSFEELQELLDNDPIYDELEHAAGIASQKTFDNEVHFILAIINQEANGSPPNNLGMVVHEAVHLEQFITAHIGYASQPTADELETHLTQYIFEEYLKFLKSNDIKLEYVS